MGQDHGRSLEAARRRGDGERCEEQKPGRVKEPSLDGQYKWTEKDGRLIKTYIVI